MRRVGSKQISLWEVQPQQSLATSCVANSAYREVTTCVQPERARYQAVTKVKRLSPEMSSVSTVEVVHLTEDSVPVPVSRRGDKSLTESETIAWYQRDTIGTWETKKVPKDDRVWGSSPKRASYLR